MYDYRTQGVNIDLGGIIGLANMKDRREAMAKDEESKRKQELVDDRRNALMEQFVLKQQSNPQYTWDKSSERTQIAGINPELLMRSDNHFKNIDENQRSARQKAMYGTAYEIGTRIRGGDTAGALALAENRRDIIKQFDPNADLGDTNSVIKMMQEGNFEQAQNNLDAVVATGVATGYLDAANPYEYQSYAPRLNEDSGMFEIAQSNALGQVRTVETGTRGETASEQEARARGLMNEQARAEASAAYTGQRLTDNANMVAGLERQSLRVNELLGMLESGVTTGIPALIKTEVASVLPMIDVSDEGAVMQGFVDLGIQNLANSFSGPTTNFELQESSKIPGRFRDATSANLAKLRGLKRMEYFAREYEDFSRKYLAGAEGMDSFRVEQAWNEELNKPQFSWDGEDINYLQLQQIAAQNNMTMNEIMSIVNRGR